MSYRISVGLSALRAAQVGMDIVGQNIANAATPGYHRQVVNLVNRVPVVLSGLERGSGVDVANISRIRSGVLETSLLEYSGDLNAMEVQLQTARQLESLVGFGAGSLSEQVSILYERMEDLSARPHDETGRRLVVEAAQELAASFRRISGDLAHMQSQGELRAKGILDDVNAIAVEIRGLNVEIDNSLAAGRNPNDLADRRESLIGELSELLDITVSQRGAVLIGDGSVLIGAGRIPSLQLSDQGPLQLQRATDSRPIDLAQGQLGGLFESLNHSIPQLQQSLDALASDIMRTLDEIHVQGVGLDGAFTTLVGQRSVSDPDIPLRHALSSIGTPVRAGTFPLTIVDDATGARTLHEISVDPEVDSLHDLANRLSALPDIVATVDEGTGTLAIRSEAGTSFDFTGVGDDPGASRLRDESHVLLALGMNTFFAGNDAKTIAVNSDLLSSPSRLATTRTGQPGDSTNLTALIESREDVQAELGGRTVEQVVADVVVGLGADVASLERSTAGLEAVHANIESQIASVSGVNPDEEVLRLLQYQRAYEAAARYLSTVNEMTLELMQII